MTDQLKQAAMQQALNLIERLNAHGWILADFEEEVYASIAALKAALEQQPVQEPLTDEEIDALANNNGTLDLVTWWRQLARSIEAAHDIKEKTND
jgi:hypothetical protein